MKTETIFVNKIKRVVFFGTPDFAVPLLEKLVATGYEVLLTVTQPDKPKKRSGTPSFPPIKEAACRLKVPVYQPENVNQHPEVISALKPDILITAAYGGYIGKVLRRCAPFGAINLHPSKLPRWRGSSPIFSALLAGDGFTANTVFKLGAKMDAGAIILQRTYAVSTEDTLTSLTKKLSEEGAKDVISALKLLETPTTHLLPQNEAEALLTRKIGKDDLPLTFRQPAQNFVCRVKALADEPGAYCSVKNKRLKILMAVCQNLSVQAQPGEVLQVIKGKGILVMTEDLPVLITKVQPEGKKIMDAFVYNLGARLAKGDFLSDGK